MITSALPAAVDFADDGADDALALSDGTHALPLALSENDRLRLLASSGGTAFSAFLLYEYETRSLRLLSFSDEAGRLHVY